MNTPIFLVGYMAAGKSSIGSLLSKQLQVPFVDTDKLIEQLENLTVDYIFEEYGEKYFRDAEADVVMSHDFKNSVVSTGGGLPCFNDNMPKLLLQGKTFYLKASVETIAERLLSSDLHLRPLLKNVAIDQLTKNIATKLSERTYYYDQADFTIETDGKTLTEIVQEISELLG